MSQMQPPGQQESSSQGQSIQQPAGGSAAGQPAVQIQQQTPRTLEFQSQNYLSRPVRQQSVAILNRALANTTDLMTQAKYAHWNVKGMNFYQLHALFDELAEVLEEHADELAERATALGGQAAGTARRAASASTVPEMPTQAVTGAEFVQLLAQRLATHDAQIGQFIRDASDRGDLDTADLLNEISIEVSKYLWFVEAHLQTQPLQGTQQRGTGQPQQFQAQQIQTQTGRQDGPLASQ